MYKKNYSKTFIALLLVLTMLIASCPGKAFAKSKKIVLKSIQVTAPKGKIIKKNNNVWYIKKGTKLNLIVKPIFNSKKIIKVKKVNSYKSFNKKIININKKGMIFAKKTGSANIFVSMKVNGNKNVANGFKRKKIKIIVLNNKQYNNTKNKITINNNTKNKTTVNNQKQETNNTSSSANNKNTTVNQNTKTSTEYVDEKGFVWEYKGSQYLKTVPRSKYHYKIKILNPNYMAPIYTSKLSDGRERHMGTDLILYVETDNIEETDYYIVGTTTSDKTGGNHFYLNPTTCYHDLIVPNEVANGGKTTITGDKSASFKVIHKFFNQSGKITFYISESPVFADGQFHGSCPIAKIEVNVQDHTPVYTAWCKKVIAACTNNSMDNWQKVEAVAKYLRENLSYEHYFPAKGYDEPIYGKSETVDNSGYIIYDDTIPFYEKGGMGLHCLGTPMVLRDITSLFGVNNVVADNHYSKVTINGESRWVDPTPDARTTSLINRKTCPYVNVDTAPEASVNPYITVTYY